VLVDGGPPGAGIIDALSDEAVEALAAAVLTHDDLDHAAGMEDVLGEVPVDSFAYGFARRGVRAAARDAGARLIRVVEGDAIRSGSLRVDVLWPPRGLAPAPDDLNATSLVLLARWHGFTILLSGDAEAELAPVNPGPVDVLKVAHHGSEDAGLAQLLDRIRPAAAVISVGEDNPYGHPTQATLTTLAEHRVPVLRTDADGDVEIEVAAGGWVARRE
jgi:competence protein ComEC